MFKTTCFNYYLSLLLLFFNAWLGDFECMGASGRGLHGIVGSVDAGDIFTNRYVFFDG